MPATRSSGLPTAASLQPILMEALENCQYQAYTKLTRRALVFLPVCLASVKQKHSKQNQDLIHKNRFLLKSTAELERVVKELKNENLELRIQAQKALSQAQYWRQQAESSSSSINPDQTKQIRIALIDIATRCKTLESSLPHAQGSLLNSSNYPAEGPTFNSTLVTSASDSLPPLLSARSRAELLALRERRRSQFQAEPEESRLSFINECSGTEDRSEATLPFEAWYVVSVCAEIAFSPSLGFPPGSSNVAFRPNRRQELMASLPNTSETHPSPNIPLNGIPNGQKTSAQHAEIEFKKDESDDSSEKQDANATENTTLADDQASGSFSLHNRAMSQLNESSSSESSVSDQDVPEDSDADEPSPRNLDSTRQDGRRSLTDLQRRSRKQRRTSLTPLHILENVSPADFLLPPLTLPKSEGSAYIIEPSRSRQADESGELKVSGTELCTPTLAGQSGSARRRDSGLTKDETDENVEAQLSQDEGWEKRPATKKRRMRAELDAVSEESHGTANNNETGLVVQASAANNLSGAGSREARRARKEVNYALPSLNKKMRRPDSDGPSKFKRKSSIKQNTNYGLQTSTTTSNKPKSTSSIKSSGATPSTVQSNTSCSNSTTLLNSSPLSSTSSSNVFSNVRPNAQSSEEPPTKLVNRTNKYPVSNLNKVSNPSDQNKDILLNRGRRRTNNL
ncbi:hypothetical protein VP01_2376g3 [Puccinia sorghi]|uniref:Shugoshin C-terminal domain-containing protein n=1 Tax=Puccinia sorghi TaxID=27349 RepID=A0A0L6V755_9BASI|nr:hypothetical protein VP01_2376g3 [Puccinia sorghi]